MQRESVNNKSILNFQYTFLSDCFDRIAEESKWDDSGE